MPFYRVYKRPVMTMVAAEQVVPILPEPFFRSHTSHMRVVQGGFMDDGQHWHQAPKRIKEAVRINGIWYWAFRLRDRRGQLLLSKDLMFPTLQELAEK